MKNLLPTRLIPGDTISLIAPASPPLTEDVVDKAVQLFSSLGFKVLLGKNARKRTGFLAGSDKERLFDLGAAFSNKKVRAIICLRGGSGSGRLLDKLPWSTIKSNPKILVGCSDITNLHSALQKKLALTTFHGPMPQSLVKEDAPNYSIKTLLRVLAGDKNALGSILTDYPNPDTVKTLRKGTAKGKLIGGNLTVLCSLLGTKHFPDLRGKVLCLEEIGEAPYRIDRLLTQLLLSGALSKVSGIALGIFENCEYRPDKSPEKKQTLADVLADRLLPLKVPIVYGLPFGHGPFNATLPFGTKAELDGKRGDLLLLENAVK